MGKLGHTQIKPTPDPSDVLAQLGLKAVALAWLSTALAFRSLRPGRSQQ